MPILFSIFVAIRFVAILLLYFLPTPNGSVLAESGVLTFIVRTIAADAGTLAIAGALFSLAAILFKKAPKALFPALYTGFSTLYIFCTLCDNETLRWLNQRFTLGYFATYMDASCDPHMLVNIIKGGLLSFGLDVLLTLAAIAAGVFVIIKFKDKFPQKKIVALPLLLLGILCISYAYYIPLKERQRRERIRPFYVHVFNEISYDFTHSEKPDHYEDGIRFLGGNPDAQYPFYKTFSDSSLKAFQNRPLSEKPDIIVLTIESLRGWVGDVRVPKSCALLKNICKLSKRGIFFPYTYSVGWPSTEGLNGMMQGVWSHPEKYSAGYHVKTRALPEILGDAGYYRIVIPAANPNFDNFTPLFEQWFDSTDYHLDINHDVPLAKRFATVYENRPKDRPVFIDWMSSTTHFPFMYPEGMGPMPKYHDDRYEHLAAYMDSAVGMVLETIEKDPRAENTIIVLTGDHSFAIGLQKERNSSVGLAHSGRTWTNMIFAGPNIPVDSIDTKTVSHADLAPTLLGLLSIEATNHFVGKNILSVNRDSLALPVISFTQTDFAVRLADRHIYGNMNDNGFVVLKSHKVPDWDTTQIVKGFIGEDFLPPNAADSALLQQARIAAHVWEYILDKDLLTPED